MVDQRPVVLCLGDSHTEGVYGGNWVASLAKEFPQLRFVNRGVNGSIASKVLERLQGDLMRLPCRPGAPAASPSEAAMPAGAGGGAPQPALSPPPLAAVTLLVGTNDVLAETNSSLFESFYRHIWQLEDPPCVLESIGHIETLLMRLEAFALAQLEAEEELEGRQQQPPPQQQKQLPHKDGQGQSKRTNEAQPRQAAGEGSTTTPTSSDSAQHNTSAPAPGPSRRLKVLLLTLPPLGEQLAGRHLLRLNVDAYNEALHAMLRHHPAWVAPGGGGVLDVSLLDLNGACQEAVRRHFLGEGWEQQQQQQQDEAKQEAAKQAGAKQGEPQDGGQLGAPTVREADGPTDGAGAGSLGSGAGKGAGVGRAGKGGLVGSRRRVPLAPPPNSAVRLALSILWCMVLRFVFRVSYDRMSDWCGSVVLTPDAVHLNERGARLVHELLAPHFRRLVGGEQGQGQEQGDQRPTHEQQG